METQTGHGAVAAVGSGGALAAVGVVGAGAMGSGIAQVAASAGHPVFLVDAFEGAAERACAKIGTSLRARAAAGKLTSEDAIAISARLTPVAAVADLPPCLLVIEAIAEDLDAKTDLFAELGRTQPAGTLLASNTSSLSIDAIAPAAAHPSRVLGLHFFNPPPVMRLVEVVRGEATAQDVLDTGAALVTRWGKVAVRCASTPGFIVNRVARPFYGEAQRMLQEGIADAATIDACLRTAGFRMGPLELTDLIGQDVNLAVGTSVWQQTQRDPRYAPTAYQQELVGAGHLGRKTGQGVYTYAEDGTATDNTPDAAAVERLLAGDVVTNPVARTLAMLVNEAVDLVRRGEAGAADVDLAMTLGTGYPKGPIVWGREIGFGVVRDHLRALDAAYPGGRYRPSPALDELS
ncbi:MAG: 3-hydroxyacyl-CoA dehydrogenase NAD-binding domain-containing protein [Candidatus Phosphoribacter sp.]